MFFESVANIWNKYGGSIMGGVGNTMLIALIGTVMGLLIGLINGIIRTVPKSKNGFIRFIQSLINFIITAYVEIFRGTPMMVQAMLIFWGYAFASGGVTLPLIPSGIFIVSINTGAYITEIVRGGIMRPELPFEECVAMVLREADPVRQHPPVRLGQRL